jgi:hypothetical protein
LSVKISVDIDCTPEEARRFMGLPDLSPLHDAYIHRMRTALEQGITPDMIEQLMKSWGPMGETGLNMWRQLMDNMGAQAK